MRRILHGAAWTLGAASLLAVLLLLAVLITGNTAGGRRFIEHEVSRLSAGKVQLSGLSGSFPSALDVAKLQFSDTQGAWMTAEQVSLRWSPWALIDWTLHVEQFGIVRASVLRRPASSPSATGSRGGRHHLPAIDIDRLAIDSLVLEPAAAGSRAILNIQGTAHYGSMQNARADVVVRRTNGTGLYELALLLDASRMKADLQLQEPAGGPIEHLANLPGLGALSVDAHIDGPRSAERLQLAARAGELRADANGTVDLQARSADLTYALQSPAMTPRPGLSWTRIELQGRVQGPVATPRASAMVDVEGLMLPDGAQLGSLHGDAAADGRLLTVRAIAATIMLPPSQPQLLQGSPLTVTAALQLDAAGRPLQLTVTDRLLHLQAHAVTSGAPSASFELQLPDLTPIAALYKQHLRGALTLSGTMSKAGDITRADVSGMGSLAGTSPVARLLGANARLRLAATLNDSAVDLQQLELSGHAVSVTASGSAERGPPVTSVLSIRTLRARWRISLPNLALLSPTLSGSLETTGTAEGPLNSLAANVQARGSFEGASLRLDASVDRVSTALYHVVIEQAAWKSLSAHADLTAGPNLAAGHGQLQLSIDHLADLQPLIGTALEGSLAANISLMPSARHPSAQLDLTARNVRIHGVLGNARLSASGPLDALRIELSAASPRLGGSPANITASARLNDTARALELDRFQMRYHGQAVRLLTQPRVMFANGVSVRNLRLGAGDAVIAIDGELSPALNFHASVQHLDAALVDAFEPNLLAQGTLSADAQVHGTRSAPVGRASLRVAGVKLSSAAAQGLPALEVSASTRFDGSTADVAAQLDAGSASRLKLTGRVPLNAAGTFAVKLAGTLDTALMNSILEQQGEHAAGTLTVAATVNGAAHAPQIAGTVSLAHGDLRDYAEGIHLGDINAKLVGGQGALRIATMSARAGPGQLSVTGTVGILQAGMPLDISIKGRHLQPITNDILTANLDADVHVGGTLRQRLDVTGSVHVNRAAISIPNGFPPSVAVLDVIVPGQKPPSPGAGTRQIVLGIRLDAPASIFVQGRGLDAQLGGTLQIAGTSAAPQVGGAFHMIRGTYSLAGTNINFTSGLVSFNGEGLKDRIDPTIDFLAQASVTYDGIPTVVNLSVTGLADAPKISLSSTPSLPQDDLLALLLFGEPASQLSALQLAETGAALASLSGIGGGGGGGSGHSLNPLTWIKHALGLNALSVGGATPPAGTAAGSGSTISGASVTAGRYVSNKVYVAATESTTGTSQVQVSIDLSASLKLQTRLGNGTATAQGTTPQNDPGSSIGLTWQHHY